MRLIFFILLTTAAFILPWQITIVGFLLYTFLYEGIELLPLAFLLDAFMGQPVPWMPLPAVYTLASTGMLVFVWGLKPLFLLDARAD